MPIRGQEYVTLCVDLLYVDGFASKNVCMCFVFIVMCAVSFFLSGKG